MTTPAAAAPAAALAPGAVGDAGVVGVGAGARAGLGISQMHALEYSPMYTIPDICRLAAWHFATHCPGATCGSPVNWVVQPTANTIARARVFIRVPCTRRLGAGNGQHTVPCCRTAYATRPRSLAAACACEQLLDDLAMRGVAGAGEASG